MKEKKTEFKIFTISQYEKEAAYLRRMHQSGWKITSIRFPGFYTFEACEPEDVVYQLDYNRDSAANKEEYVQMFADCGWNYLFDFVDYSYFCKPAAAFQGTEEKSIFCDDASRLDMMKRIALGRLFPLFVIFACIVLPQLWMQLSDLNKHPVISFTYIALFVLYCVIFLAYGIHYYTFKKKIGK